ncbi:hypothetical protein [Priestia megaterium]|uniref:hypothetical protein n=1 Tax=Priestia megaterium TaxID=1404 RepID=UPI00112800C0|nr:hypothetical protein [Priestia megaterium]TPF17246.1 hypothetical protein CBE78_13410 [Priestia megaterium]TPF23778.1 hypothetical protein CBE79_13220 [Priestia megaterium]
MADELKKMLDDKEKVQLIIAAVVMLGGLVVLLKSVETGQAMGQKWLESKGNVDTDLYLETVKSYIHLYQIVGGVMFGGGLLTLLRAKLKK